MEKAQSQVQEVHLENLRFIERMSQQQSGPQHMAHRQRVPDLEQAPAEGSRWRGVALNRQMSNLLGSEGSHAELQTPADGHSRLGRQSVDMLSSVQRGAQAPQSTFVFETPRSDAGVGPSGGEGRRDAVDSTVNMSSEQRDVQAPTSKRVFDGLRSVPRGDTGAANNSARADPCGVHLFLPLNYDSLAQRAKIERSLRLGALQQRLEYARKLAGAKPMSLPRPPGIEAALARLRLTEDRPRPETQAEAHSAATAQLSLSKPVLTDVPQQPVNLWDELMLLAQGHPLNVPGWFDSRVVKWTDWTWNGTAVCKPDQGWLWAPLVALSQLESAQYAQLFPNNSYYTDMCFHKVPFPEHRLVVDNIGRLFVREKQPLQVGARFFFLLHPSIFL